MGNVSNTDRLGSIPSLRRFSMDLYLLNLRVLRKSAFGFCL